MMDATPISFENATPLGVPLHRHDADVVDATVRRWTALHDAAALVAGLARVAPAPGATNAFAAALRQAPSWRRNLAEQGVEDLAAIMEPGLAALISVHTGGGDATAPALALWQEFIAARDALVTILQPEG